MLVKTDEDCTLETGAGVSRDYSEMEECWRERMKELRGFRVKYDERRRVCLYSTIAWRELS